MKSEILRQIFLLIGLFFLQINLIGQNSDCYENLDFKSFMIEKVENDTSLLRELYKNIRYPSKQKKYEAQGIVEILIINHDIRDLEVIQLNMHTTFPDVADNLRTALGLVKIDRKQPFITRFYAYFDIEPFKYKKEDYQKYYFGLINNNMLVVQKFIVPSIHSH